MAQSTSKGLAYFCKFKLGDEHNRLMAEDDERSGLESRIAFHSDHKSRFSGKCIRRTWERQCTIHEERTIRVYSVSMLHQYQAINFQRICVIDWGQHPNFVPSPSSPAPSVAGRHCRCQRPHKHPPKGGILSIAPRNGFILATLADRNSQGALQEP